jgi:thymidylate synthase
MLPYNIASYGLLLQLLATHAKLEVGKLIGFLMDTHIYSNHLEQVKVQLEREPRPLPKLVSSEDKLQYFNILEWEATDSSLQGYDPHPTIKADVAV